MNSPALVEAVGSGMSTLKWHGGARTYPPLSLEEDIQHITPAIFIPAKNTFVAGRLHEH
jgi:hypothetical protein